MSVETMWRHSRRAAASAAVAVTLMAAGMSGVAAIPAAPAPAASAAVTAVTVAWNSSDYPTPAPGVTRTYTVEVTTGGGAKTSDPVAASPVTVTGLSPLSAFTAVVHAFDDGAPVIDSDPSSAVTPTTPSAVSSVTVRPGNGKVTVSWPAVAGATGYTVKRQTLNVPGTITVGSTSSRRAYFVDTTVTNGTVYRYSVVANSTFTVPSSGTTSSDPRVSSLVRPATTPKAPTALKGTAGERAAILTWTPTPAANNGGWPVTNYVVVESDTDRVLPSCTAESSAPCAAIPRNKSAVSPSRIVRNLGADRVWRFRVRAVNSVGQSANSGISPKLQPTTKEPPFSRGMRGATITELQNRLNWAGLYLPVTGVYDAATERQVRHLQEKFLYDQTGIVSPGTWRLLKRITADGAELPSSCLSTSLCISKTQRLLRYVVNGEVVETVDVRFGPEGGGFETPEGLFQVNWKDRDHISSGYGTPMPFTMNFYGGAAVHYSPFFNAVGYWGNSHGCVNVRDWDTLERIYDRVWVGTPVYIYW